MKSQNIEFITVVLALIAMQRLPMVGAQMINAPLCRQQQVQLVFADVDCNDGLHDVQEDNRFP